MVLVIQTMLGGSVDTNMTEEEAYEQLHAFAMDPRSRGRPCEVFRTQAARLKRTPPFPFSVWLEERWANGARAEQVLRVLNIPPAGDGSVTDEKRWEGLRQLAEEDNAWDIVAEMAVTPKLSRACPRKVSLVVDGLRDVAQLVASSQRIMVLAGAGISASCGIPTFRDAEAGFFAGIAKKYGLSSDEEISSIDCFRRDPRPWFEQVRSILPTTASPRTPSLTHRFIRKLEDRGKLLHLFTQNIDTLESVAGITRVTCCHGSFATATCMNCGARTDGTAANDAIAAGHIPRCVDGGVLKPDVTFFGEAMPAGVTDLILEHVESADLLLVMGTSLRVKPCSLIPNLMGTRPEVPRILINKEVAGEATDFDGFLEGPCDDVVAELLKHLGWPDDAEMVD